MQAEHPEFSRPVTASDIPARGTEIEISAETSEREALARRFSIESISSLRAHVRLRPISGGTLVRVSGDLVADVVQSCVVTLQPVPAHVEAGFSVTFGPEMGEDDEDGEIEIDLDHDDPPDPMIGGIIDIGEVVAEQLALALEPFPRAPDAVFTPPADVEDEPVEKASPFATLAQLRKK